MPWPAVHADPGAPSVRVMSYNVDVENKGDAAILEQVDRYSPDVLFLVEHASTTSDSGARGAVPLGARRDAVRRRERLPVESKLDPEKLRYSGRLRSPSLARRRSSRRRSVRSRFYAVHPLSRATASTPCGAYGMMHEILCGHGASRSAARTSSTYNSGLRAPAGRRLRGRGRAGEGPGRHRAATRICPGSATRCTAPLRLPRRLHRGRMGLRVHAPVGGRHAPWMRIDRIMAQRRGPLHPLRGRLRARVGPRRASSPTCSVRTYPRRGH